jgi:anti-anti-sigma factor
MSLHRETTVNALPRVPAAPPAASPAGARRGRLAMLCVTEPLDATGASRMQEKLGGICLSCGRLVLDLTAVAFIDSDGVRALLSLAETLEAAEKRLGLVIRPGSRVERTLRLLCLLERFRVYPDLASACREEPLTPAH